MKHNKIWMDNERVKGVLDKTYGIEEFIGCSYNIPERVLQELLQIVAEEAVKYDDEKRRKSILGYLGHALKIPMFRPTTIYSILEYEDGTFVGRRTHTTFFRRTSSELYAMNYWPARPEAFGKLMRPVEGIDRDLSWDATYPTRFATREDVTVAINNQIINQRRCDETNRIKETIINEYKLPLHRL